MKLILKSTVILSAIFGAILGFLLLIPVVNWFSFIGLFCAMGATVIYYLKKNQFVGILSLQDGALIGAVSGFCALISASIIFAPLKIVFDMAFDTLFRSGNNFLSAFIMTSYGILSLTMITLFIAILSAIFNAFSGVIAAFVYEKLEGSTETQPQNDIVIE